MTKATRQAELDIVHSIYGMPAGTTIAEKEMHYYRAFSELNRENREITRVRDRNARIAKQRRDAKEPRLKYCKLKSNDDESSEDRMELPQERNDEPTVDFAEIQQERSDELTERSRAGFISDNHDALKRFIRRVPRRALHSRDGKKYEETHNRTGKVLIALDAEYVGINEMMRGWIRVAMKADFTDIDELRGALQVCGVPEPTFVVCAPGGGVLAKPHLIYLLATPVNFGAKGKPKPIAAYHAIERGLTYKLLDIGADAEAIETSGTMNPVSPRNECHIIAEEPFGLLDLGKFLDRRVTNAMLNEGHAPDAVFDTKIAELAKQNGNVAFWNGMMMFACREVKAWWTADKRNAEQFQLAMREFGQDFGVRCRCSPVEIERVIGKTTDWVWANHDPSKITKFKVSGQGPCREKTKGKSVTEAKSIGGKFTSNLKREKTSAAISGAKDALISEGITIPTNRQIADRAGVNTRTVERFNQAHRSP